MIPAKDRSLRASEWRLRELAGEAEQPVSHAQFQRYVRAGLVPAPDDDGRWPLDVAERLTEVHRLAHELRPIDSRVIRIAARFAVDPAHLRAALISVGQRVHDPRRTLQIVLKYGMSRERLRRPAVPRKAEWSGLLSRANDDQIRALSPGWLAMAYEVLPAWYSQTTDPLAGIDREVIVVMLAIDDLARREASLT